MPSHTSGIEKCVLSPHHSTSAISTSTWVTTNRIGDALYRKPAPGYTRPEPERPPPAAVAGDDEHGADEFHDRERDDEPKPAADCVVGPNRFGRSGSSSSPASTAVIGLGSNGGGHRWTPRSACRGGAS